MLIGKSTLGKQRKKIWIDFDNSPHVPFFRPIIGELERRDYEIMLTARNCFQVAGLVNLFNLDTKQIGRHYGRNKILKVGGTFYRALQLRHYVLREKPDLAVSHGSRAQILAANLLRMRSVVIYDYEYSKGLIFARPTFVLVPEVIPDSAIKMPPARTRKYPGIKEDVYVPEFSPNPQILKQLSLSNDDFIITVRPPATEAHYYSGESERLFRTVVEFLGHIEKARLVILPRSRKQEVVIRDTWRKWLSTGRIIIPKVVVDGLNLMWHSELVISGGGTMNREAAALGVPVYSIFRSKIGAVDRYLEAAGRLTLLENEEDARRKIVLERRKRYSKPRDKSMTTLNKIVGEIIAIIKN
jgi:predicted glycosyltransferase